VLHHVSEQVQKPHHTDPQRIKHNLKNPKIGRENCVATKLEMRAYGNHHQLYPYSIGSGVNHRTNDRGLKAEFQVYTSMLKNNPPFNLR